MKPRLILASKSSRRRSLLKTLKIPFKVVPSGMDESTTQTVPAKLVQELARRKAGAVAQKHPADVVVGADTVVVLDGKILGQPKDPNDAYRMLYRLSGSTHYVYTGVAVAANGKLQSDHAVSTVRMKKLDLGTLMRLSRKNLDKAGAYAIQSKRDPIAQVVKGTYDNVVGLPVELVRKLLRPYFR
jgi:septum formation protein